MNKKTLSVFFMSYLISAVVSFAVFSWTSPNQGLDSSGSDTASGDQDDQTALSALLQIEPGEPKDQTCPLNGALYTKTEQKAWATRRPLAVMIENSPDARPQSGLSQADIVFEAMAEGGVTRFMGMFYCAVQKYDTTLAPVRSARTYFIDWASGFNRPLYVHVGGANIPGPADALGQISSYGWSLENDVNQFSVGYPTFVRNANRLDGKDIATEHTMETTTEKLWTVGVKREWTNLSPQMKLGKKIIEPQEWLDGYRQWKFLATPMAVGDTKTISYEFWDGYSQYAVKWEYDATTDSYKRVMAGEPHVDLNNSEQIMAKNVVVLLTREKGPIDELKHLLYTTTGTGNALIFRNGTVEKGSWSKKDRESQLVFTDRKGKEIEFVPGMIWISVADTDTEVTY
jgi:hypothetical protein